MESGRRKLFNTLETELSWNCRVVFFSPTSFSQSLWQGAWRQGSNTFLQGHTCDMLYLATCEPKQNPRPFSLSVALFHAWRSVLRTEINKIFITLIKCTCVFVYGCGYLNARAQAGQKHRDSLELSCPTCILGTKCTSSTSAVWTLNCWAVSHSPAGTHPQNTSVHVAQVKYSLIYWYT